MRGVYFNQKVERPCFYFEIGEECWDKIGVSNSTIKPHLKIEVDEWLKKNCEGFTFMYYNGPMGAPICCVITLNDKKQAIMFKLAWLGND